MDFLLGQWTERINVPTQLPNLSDLYDQAHGTHFRMFALRAALLGVTYNLKGGTALEEVILGSRGFLEMYASLVTHAFTGESARWPPEPIRWVKLEWFRRFHRYPCRHAIHW